MPGLVTIWGASAHASALIAKSEATMMSSRTAATLTNSIFSRAWYTTGAIVRVMPMTSSIPIAIGTTLPPTR
jgi:hypothetical protein